jgi:hypothetical protein
MSKYFFFIFFLFLTSCYKNDTEIFDNNQFVIKNEIFSDSIKNEIYEFNCFKIKFPYIIYLYKFSYTNDPNIFTQFNINNREDELSFFNSVKKDKESSTIKYKYRIDYNYPIIIINNSSTVSKTIKNPYELKISILNCDEKTPF